MHQTVTRSISTLIVGGTCGVFAAQTHAAGFALIEQSASGLGKAFAGMAASSEDASSLFYNPAAIAHVSGTQASVAGHYVLPRAEFTDEGSTTALDIPLTGSEGGDAGIASVVPNFYFKSDLGNGLHAGIGITVPFGLATGYDKGWQGRYHAQLSDLQTVVISPTLALKASERFVLGASFNIEHGQARLTSRIDLGSVCFEKFDDPNTAADEASPICTPLGLLPQQADGSVDISGDGWAYGFTFGAMFSFDRTRIGASYRSSIAHTLEDTADFTIPSNAALLQGGGALADTNATAMLTMPDIASLSVSHGMSDRLDIYGDITATHWTTFEDLTVQFENSNQPTSTQPENWRSTLRYSVGGVFRLNSILSLRGGVAYDQTPVRSSALRTPRVPDNDRRWFALGLNTKFSRDLSLDMAYAYLLMDDAKINNAEESTHSTLRGSYSSAVNIVSAQLNYIF